MHNKTNRKIFNREECLRLSQQNLAALSKELRKKSRSNLIGVLFFPVVYILLITYNQLYVPNPFSIKNILLASLPFLFFSYVLYSGGRGGTKALRKKIALNKNALPDLEAIEELIHNQQKYILYLRDYSTGADYHSSAMVKMPSFVGGYSEKLNYGSIRLSEVTKALQRHLPIVMLHNNRDQTEEYVGHVLHCPDTRWFDYFKILADHATIITIDYQGNFDKSAAIKSEISHINKLEKFFVVVGSDGDVNQLKRLRSAFLSSAKLITVETKDHGYDKGIVIRKGKEQVVSFPADFENWLSAIST